MFRQNMWGLVDAVSNSIRRSSFALILLVVCVGTTQAQNRYSISADGGEAVDINTGLTWVRCSAGQNWTGSTCAGTAVTYVHEAALSFAQSQVGWRLPNAKELSSLVSRMPGSSAVDTVAFPGTANGCYWSSTPNANNPAQAWQVELGGNRFVSYRDRSFLCSVRLVR